MGVPGSNPGGQVVPGIVSKCRKKCRTESIRIPISILGMQNWINLNSMGCFSSKLKSL